MFNRAGITEVMVATTGFVFISPTNGWEEIIAEALAISLAATAVQMIVTGVYSRWRSENERTLGEAM